MIFARGVNHVLQHDHRIGALRNAFAQSALSLCRVSVQVSGYFV